MNRKHCIHKADLAGQKKSRIVLMMMQAVSLVWAGAVEKSEQSGVGFSRKRVGVVRSSNVVGSSMAKVVEKGW